MREFEFYLIRIEDNKTFKNININDIYIIRMCEILSVANFLIVF